MRHAVLASDLARNLAGVKNLELQAAYWRAHFPALSTQADKVRSLSIPVTADAAKQPKIKVTLGMDDLRRQQKHTLPHLRLAVSVEDQSPAPTCACE